MFQRSSVVLPSMFKEALRDVVEGTEGGLAGLLDGLEGIALESYTKDGSPFDINTIGAEFSVVIGRIKRAAEMLEAGDASEVAVGTDKLDDAHPQLGDTLLPRARDDARTATSARAAT